MHFDSIKDAVIITFCKLVYWNICLKLRSNPPELEVMSAIFLLVCFAYLKDTTCGRKEKVLYFTSKVFFLEIMKFQLFRYSNVMT